jgi:isocitrate dehydrogenase kinase/phosphatase
MSTPEAYQQRLAEMAARAIASGFDAGWERFNAITSRARSRFEERDWHGMMADMGERLEVHPAEVARAAARLRGLLGEQGKRVGLWVNAKRAFAALVPGRSNRELAETFFNSVSRRMLGTVGKNSHTEFDSDEFVPDPSVENPAIHGRYLLEGDGAATVRGILEECAFVSPYEDLSRDAQLAGREIRNALAATTGSAADREPRAGSAGGPEAFIETIRAVFFRQKLACIVGRVRLPGAAALPLVIVLRHSGRGIALDAVLTSEAEMSIVFSFTRSHFHVETGCPRDLVVFLKECMPPKPVDELYIALGFDKQGKTELYRSLRRFLGATTDRFEFAPGDPGMVMIVFTLPSYHVVFKVIRDHFMPPKKNTRQEVMERYRLVFSHDRAGRLVEAQEFEHLEFRADQFREELLEELRGRAASSVIVRDGAVVIKHMYVERKVTPLNLFLKQAPIEEAHDVVLDYGEAVKELAAVNIFPGDLLEKNFGVTRHGRVVFYDYDELCLTTDCNFREIPPARSLEEELSDEPPFAIGENDVFPEEFARFLSLGGQLREEFVRRHAELFNPGFWRDLQSRLWAGEIIDVYPYPQSKRLRP